jgi:hypothetical protein
MKTELELICEFMNKRHTHYNFYRGAISREWIKSRRSTGAVVARYTDQEFIDQAKKDGYK